jgi:hypothetical protein
MTVIVHNAVSIKVKLVVKRIFPDILSPSSVITSMLIILFHILQHKSLLSLVITGTSGNDDGMY